MSKRLQVIVSDADYRDLETAARADQVSVSEWVRAAIRLAKSRPSEGSIESKLKAIAVGFGYDFPTSDIGQMLDEIESGYR